MTAREDPTMSYEEDKEKDRRKRAVVTPFSLLWKKIQEKRADKALQALVAASAVAAVAGAGIVGADRINALSSRLEAVEGRPAAAKPVDLAPVRRESAALAKKVDDLSRETAALKRALGMTPAKLPTKAQVAELGNKIRSTSAQLNGLAGQIKATANATREKDRVLAGQLSTLATDVSTLTNDLSGRITAVEGGRNALVSQVEASSKQLSGLRTSLGVVQKTLGAVSTRMTNIETALSAVDAKANRAIAGLPLGIAITQLRVTDGGSEVRPVGSLDGGEYIIEWSVQDGYGCNGDPISFVSDGKVVASWQLSYGKCDRQTFTQRFELPEGGHDVAVSVGCGPKGNGDCIVDVLAVVTRVGG